MSAAEVKPTEIVWVEAAQAGERKAFERLYHAHARRVAGLVYRLLGIDADLDEVVQEVFVAAWTGLKGLRDPERFGGWLSGIAVRLVRQRIARRQRWRTVLSRLATTAPSAPSVEPYTGEAGRALASLPPHLRVPFVLHRLEGFSVPETASMCETSESTAKRRCQEAARRLRRRMT